MIGTITKRKADQLPTEVHAALVETLFVTTGSFVAGLIGGVLVPSIAWLRSRDPIYLVCAVVVLLLTVVRLVVFALHRAADEEARQANAAYWERLYAAAGISFMTAVGLTAAMLCAKQQDAVTTLYGVVMTLGFAGALAGRNAGRPFIVYGQVLGVCLPLVAVFMFHNNNWYMGVSAMLVLVMASTRSTTKFLNGIIVSALVNGREARLQRTRFSTALDNMSHGLCMADKDGMIIVINRRLREFFHLPDDLGDIDARQLAEMIASSSRMSPQARKGFVAAWEAQVAKNEPLVFSETIAGRLYDFRCEPSETTGVVFIVEDVTEARIASRQIEHMAHFDALTGLPNRMHFHNQLESRLAKAMAAGKRLALLSVDLDQFKEVNDTRGHPTGDALLRLVAKRLRQSVKNADLVARFGGDEFQVLMQVDSERAADNAADRIIQTLSASYTIDGQIITIGASIGIAFTSETIATADELLRCADLALYRSKADGKGVFRHFSPQLDVAVRRKREIEQDLRDAIANDTLELHYQPIVDVRTGQVVVCEALVRMRHPVKGMIPPDEFISIAEETGLIVQLGEWVLRRACSEAVHWPRWVNVAVNFSAKQFVLRRNLVEDILEALDASGLDPSRLEVEITESTIIEAKDARDQLQAISAAGIKISLDDFGTGYSSLSYLRQFPVDKIKIDRSFADDIHSRAAQAVIGSVSVLGHLLGVQVVMEGIETEEQLDAMRSWKVHLVQGYLFSRPQTQAATMELLLRNQPFPTSVRHMTAREQLQSLEAFLNDQDSPVANEIRLEAKNEGRELRRAAAAR